MIFFLSVLFVLIILQQLEIVVLYKMFNGFLDDLVIKIVKRIPKENGDHSEAE